AVRSALFVKVAQHATNDPAEQLKLAPQNERAAGWENFRYASLLDLARECLLADGVNCRGWSGDDVAIAALGGHPTALGHRATWAYNTSSFAGLSRDAVNRSMLNGYRERPSSWRLVFRTAPSVPNFKDIHRLQIGTTGAAPVWPDNSPITELPLGGGEVTYAIEAYAGKRSFSWKAIVNNDLDLISRTPFQLGRTMDRTVNKAAWMQIIKNPLMPDGQTLFLETPAGNRPSSNYTVGATAPTTAVIGAMAAKMALVKGLPDEEGNAPDDVLAVAPKFIAVPVALGTTTDQLVKSAFDPAGGASQVYNTASNLIPVSEPLLDFYGSATAFYLLADPADVDTVEVTFLEGHEEPKITMHTDPETYALVYSAVQAFGAKVVDWRGIQKHKGAA
ncbi:MAG TPA: hypothetical protein VGE52_01790, partial [Pirellulales bacterium]